MHWLRTATVLACAHVIVLLGLPAAAGAATPPTLTSPAANAPASVEGSSLSFEWTGTLQGDPDALGRSFFRLEIIKAANLPAGAQAEWPAASIENSVQTEPGSSETTASLGVPATGDYRWRVCAWGVADDMVDNTITQLPGGCSAARAFSTVAAANANHSIGELKMEEKTQVEGETRTVTVERPAPATPAPPVEVEPAPVAPAAPEELAPTTFSDVQKTASENGDGSALGLGDGFSADSASDREGLGGSIMSGLSTTLPLVPIPFWVLALLLACFPILRLWRTSVLGMFDWDDGSIDGRGTFDDVNGELALVPVATEIKIDSMTADGTAAAPAPTDQPFAPERGRRAA